MAISVGSVSVDIVPNATKFRSEMNAKLKDLTASVRVTLNDKAFEAEIARATHDRVVNVKVDDKGSIKQMQGRSHALLTSLALLAPAAAPLTAVAIGGAAALAGLGGAGILAFKGITAEMKAGTPIGKQYTTMLGNLETDLGSLEKVAARGVLTGVRGSIVAVNQQMPELTREVRLLSASLGSDLTPLTRGLVALFQDLFPTTQSIAGGIHSLAVDFEAWATGAGGKAFAAYLAKELPIVAAALGSIAQAGAHVVSALLPLGGPVLAAITGISQAIAHIPVQVIRDLFLAFAAYKTITLTAAAIDRVTAATTRLKTAQTRGIGAKGTGGLGAAGPIGLLATGLLIGKSTIDSSVSGRVDRQTQGLIDSPAALKAAQARQQQLAAQLSSLRPVGPTVAGKGGAGAVAGNTAALQGQYQTLTKEINDAKTATGALGGAVAATNGDIRSNATVLAAAKAALTAWTTKLDDAFTKASGLKSANIGVRQAIADANTALKANGRTLDLHTQKGRDNASALLAVATAEHTKIDADVAGGRSQKTINKDFADARNKLIQVAEKFGASQTAAKRYADSLLGIKPLVKTVVKIDTAAAAAKVAALKAGLSAIQFYAGQKDSGPTAPQLPHGTPSPKKRSRGGPVWGAGTGTSDSIPALLSNGEYVLRASAVSKIGVPTLNQMNRYAAGGLVGKLGAVKGYATGGLVNANIASIAALLAGPSVTSANVSAAKLAEARATVTLLAAEAALHNLRRNSHATNGQIQLAEKRIANDRLALSAATTRLSSTERAYAAGRQPLLTRFAAASRGVARADGTFLSNLNKLASRGFGFLAQQLLAQGDSNAMAEAAQAVKWGNSQLSSLQRTLQADARYQAGLAAFGSSPAAAPGVAQGQGPATIYVKLTEAGEWMLSQSDARTASQLRQQARGMAGRR